MSKVQVVPQIDLNEVLESVAQLDIPEIEQFAFQVNRVLASRKAPGLPEKEAELLEQINRGLPPATQARYEELNARLHANRLTSEEHQELLGLVDQVELADAKRLKHLIELAQVRGVPLDALMCQLGIERPADA
jgi:hypothetical protein